MALATRPWDMTASLPLVEARRVQQAWALRGIRERIAIARAVRHRIAGDPLMLARSIRAERSGSLCRSVADTLVAEVLPLVDACRFLERQAEAILAPQRQSSRARPLWLHGTTVEIHREPLGIVLIIGPSNYPLFLPGVQALQALTAGNAVLWKPAPGGSAAAHALRGIFVASGLDPALFSVLDESAEAAAAAIRAGVGKVFLTGSVATGRAVLQQLAENMTRSVMELSGCDAVFVLPGANIEHVVDALCFGLRFNGSATCMAPRRVFLVDEQSGFIPKLIAKLKTMPAIALNERTRTLLRDLLDDAELYGSSILRDEEQGKLRYAVVENATPEMRVARADVFAPVLAVFNVPDDDAAIAAASQCPYALTAAIFGPEQKARALASRTNAGVVFINGLIVAAADPRVPFGGRRSSGYGSTRGREGLLEMTAPKAFVVQRGRNARMYSPTTPDHEGLFGGYIMAAHGHGFKQRMQGLRKFLRAGARLK